MKETELQYTERMLRDMLAEAEAAEKAAADEARIARNKAALARTEKATALLNKANRPHPPRATADMAQASRDSLLDGLFPRTEWPEPPKAQFPRLADKSADRRSDFVIAALGITLGLICALFPWYIFFNQEQFGVQAIK
ncbi:hypothetical protein FJ980_04530, partial [Mesorhizobium sp. B1-1-5]